MFPALCRCNAEDILLEMDRILRPEGAVIFRDEVDVLIKVRKIVRGMRWDTKMVDHEDGPLVPEKILIAVKQYWVAGGNSTSTQWVLKRKMLNHGIGYAGNALCYTSLDTNLFILQWAVPQYKFFSIGRRATRFLFN